MMNHHHVVQLIQSKLAGSTVEVIDLTGMHDHIEVHVTSELFRGKSLLDQHKIIMNIMRESLRGPLHAIKIKTFIPHL